MLKKSIYACLATILFSGCVTTNVLQDTPEQKEILLVGDSGFVSLSGMQVDAVKKANDMCSRENKKYMMISKRVQPQGFGVFPEVNLVFTCE